MLALAYLGVADRSPRSAPAQQVATSRPDAAGARHLAGRRLRRALRAPTIAVERSVLHGVLRDALTAPRSHRRRGHRVQQDAGRGDLRFADGGSEGGDLLIGADGIHGTVRDALLGPRPQPLQRLHRLARPRPHEHPDIPPGTFNAMFGPGTRFTYYDIAPGVVHWMSVANGPAGGRGGARQTREHAARRHAGWTGPVAEILDATPQEGILRGDVVGRRPERRWGQGRVTLLGDAAHAMTFNIGQGACQAIEDALVLAGHLVSPGVTVTQALRAYEAERQERTRPMQLLAHRIGVLGSLQNPVAVWLRDRVMGLTWNKTFQSTERDHVAYGTRWNSGAATTV